MSPQTLRILLLAAVMVGAYAAIRPAMVPETFGEEGHYRAAAVTEEAAREPLHVGNAACVECHEEAGDALGGGMHAELSCEGCHGTMPDHVREPERFAAVLPSEEHSRQACGQCHHDRTGRPESMTLIDIAEHEEPDEPCVACHAPHEAE